ncbi:MAG: carbohydrate-binding domain-containing protein [Breznakibacter sp.]
MKTFTFATLLCMLSLSHATGQRPDNAVDLADGTGTLFYFDTYYTRGSTSGTQQAYTNHVYTSATASAGITVRSGSVDHNLLLYDVDIAKGSSSMTFQSTTAQTVNFYGSSTFANTAESSSVSGYNNPNINMSTAPSSFTINGNKLTLITSEFASYGAIGALSTSVNLKSTSLTINIKYLEIDVLSSTQRAIGAFNANYQWKSITINDDCVFTANGTLMADKVVIGKASVKLSGQTVSAVNTNDESVYCVTVPRHGTQTIAVTDKSTEQTEYYTFTYVHPDDDNYYLYLPNGEYGFISNGTEYVATVDGAGVTASLPAIQGDGAIDVSMGTILITDDGYQIGSQLYTYDGETLTLTGTTIQHSVTVFTDRYQVVLNGVDIQLSANCPFNLNSGKNLTLLLAEGTENTLKCGTTYAALQKKQMAGMLTIAGKGILYAESSGAPGIGSAVNADFANLTIEEGTITATTTATNVAAIGTTSTSAGTADCSHVYINGGQVTATAYANAYVIGGSVNSDLFISGGRVLLHSGNPLNTVNYLLPKNITITGGTVFGKVTNGSQGHLETSLIQSGTIITGGTVNMQNLNGDFKITGIGRPTNGDANVYRSMYKIPHISEPIPVDGITVNGQVWNSSGVYTDAEGMLYLWLPVSASTTVVVTVGHTAYTYSGQTVAYDFYVPADEEKEVDEYGNYWWQVPVAVSAEGSGTVALTDGMTEIATGSYVCSRTALMLTVVANEGWTLRSLTLNGQAIESGISFNASDDIGIEAVFALSTAIGKTTGMAAKAYTNNHLLFVEAPAGTEIEVYSVAGVLLARKTATGDLQCFSLPSKGICLVKIMSETGNETIKCLGY